MEFLREDDDFSEGEDFLIEAAQLTLDIIRQQGTPRVVILKSGKRSSPFSHCFKISCSIAQPETLKIVQATIAKQLSIDETSVAPATKFGDLGADSLDTVEIMMALEEKFGVSIGENGADNISTVQDAADLIQKVKTQAS
ncbi:hypothetical protein E3N88_21497 [Mikania micrantha]|uniref:Acyl carrier protein n=1 Tax=Mikania micrantha TaxID=192012 RepID=A0A5N6NKE2_9ASTR|nr:hypothetical protein E3N88_21497 [Mikania micrantha]